MLGTPKFFSHKKSSNDDHSQPFGINTTQVISFLQSFASLMTYFLVLSRIPVVFSEDTVKCTSPDNSDNPYDSNSSPTLNLGDGLQFCLQTPTTNETFQYSFTPLAKNGLSTPNRQLDCYYDHHKGPGDYIVDLAKGHDGLLAIDCPPNSSWTSLESNNFYGGCYQFSSQLSATNATSTNASRILVNQFHDFLHALKKIDNICENNSLKSSMIILALVACGGTAAFCLVSLIDCVRKNNINVSPRLCLDFLQACFAFCETSSEKILHRSSAENNFESQSFSSV